MKLKLILFGLMALFAGTAMAAGSSLIPHPLSLDTVPVQSRGITPTRNIRNYDVGADREFTSKFGQMLAVKPYSATLGDTLLGYVDMFFLNDSTVKIGTDTIIHTGNVADYAGGTDITVLPAATSAGPSERFIMADSSLTTLKLSKQMADSVQTKNYLKRIYAKTASTVDYNFLPNSILRNDTIFTAFRTGPDHNITGSTSTAGVKLAAFNAFSGALYYEEWVSKDSTSSILVNNPVIGDAGNGKIVVFYTMVFAEGVPGVSARDKRVYQRIRSASGTWGTKTYINAGYLYTFQSGWQSCSDFDNCGTDGWKLCVYGGYHATTPGSNRTNYDNLILRSYNGGTTWALYDKVVDGNVSGGQPEEPQLLQFKEKDANGQTVMREWAFFSRYDGGGGSYNSIGITTTSGPTDTLNWTTPLSNNRPVPKFAGAGFPAVIALASTPGRLMCVTRYRTDGMFTQNAKDFAMVYYISDNNGNDWAGPYFIDFREQKVNEKFMYASIMESSWGDVIMVFSMERNGDSGQADLFMVRIPFQELGSNITPTRLEIDEIYGAPVQYHPNKSNKNIALGRGAMGNTPVTSATNTVMSNTFLGQNAGQDCTTCRWNIGIGADSTLQNITSGLYNIAIGDRIMGATAGFTGSLNTLLNERAGYLLSSGSDNFFAQQLAGGATTTGSGSVAIGKAALPSNTTGSRHVAIGQDAGPGVTTGTDDVFIGRTPSFGNVTGDVYIGTGTAITDVGLAWAKSSYRMFLAGAGNTSATGLYNFAGGREAMQGLTSGSENIGLGGRALRSLTTGTNNTAIGYSNITQRGPLESVTTGSYNTAVGGASLSKTTGDENTAIGYFSGQALTTGTRNTFLGNEAGISITTGGSNTFVGRWSGGGTNWSNATALSDGAGTVRFFANSSGKTVLGGSTVDASAQLSLSATDGGFLPNRLTTTQRNAISSPTGGLFVFNITSSTWDGYNGSAWGSLLNSTAADAGYWKLNGNSFGANATVGTNDAFRFGIETNGVERLSMSSTGQVTTNSMTDFRISVSDSLEMLSQGTFGWKLSNGFSRLVGASGIINYQANNSTGAVSMNMPDNTSNALSVNIQGGISMLSLSTTDGAESVTMAGDLRLDKTNTASGTTGAQTINKTTGSVNFAAAATSLVVTNSLVSNSSVIQLTVGSNDATMKSAAVVVGAGSFTIYPNAAPTGETRVYFTVTN